MSKDIPMRLTTAPVEAGLLVRIKIGDPVFAHGKEYHVIGFRGDRVRLEREPMQRQKHRRKRKAHV
jgi:hypothetical protein